MVREMTPAFPLRSAADFMDSTFLAKWADRGAFSGKACTAL